MDEPPQLLTDLRPELLLLGAGLALIWGISGLNLLLFRGRLNRFGIRPRSQDGLMGILFAPLLHGNWAHLAANTPPFVVLGWFVLLRGRIDFAIVTAIATLTSGLGAWLLGAPRSVHIGTSGVVFGYLGFLLARGYFEQSLLASGVAIAVALLYGPTLWGVLPLRTRRVSWQGHLCGFLGGVAAARYLEALQGWLELWLKS
jgi:membrane associated rhomboid family serine protease